MPNQDRAPTLFSPSFLKMDIHQVVKDLNEKGYFAFESALHHDALRAIEADATRIRLSLNRNGIGGVYAEKQYYLTNLLAVSKTFFDFCTSSFVFDICKKFLGERFRLKALRYYETYGGHHMQWHTDNKTDKGFAHIPGLIFIFYISDVEDGEFQYVEGSHKWSGETAYSNYTDEFIETKYGPLIKSFKMPRGSLVIYNTYGIHRARPARAKNFVRKSVFFQVDSEMEKSELIVVNTEYLGKIDDTLSMYLGFGQPAGYDVYPSTSLNTLRFNRPLVRVLVKWFAYRVARTLFDRVPLSWQNRIKARLRG